MRYTGFSFLAVEVEPGHRPRLKVTALAESGERIDHFEVRRGADGPRRTSHGCGSDGSGRRAGSVAGGAAVVPAVEGALEGGGGVLAVGVAVVRAE